MHSMCTVMESRFTLGQTTAENTHFMKKASNKNCSEFNFLQKTQWAHMSIYLGSGDKGLQRLPCFKYSSGKTIRAIFKYGYVIIQKPFNPYTSHWGHSDSSVRLSSHMFLWFCCSWSALGTLITHPYEVFMDAIKIFFFTGWGKS